ncbi:carotenoid biosynthesis protein [Rhodococcus sp. Z13]|uniref:Carotenoid biosynthesis protein n=1 Tax=Rhodococcus sacchari TaxID=2962047 RepID=A0ACD4DBK6_9NOCA|nr:carotenoid biosynthesis protein [Rhodococcus sp. Z13]UYP17474.1 carotenoid biosynthesis protein [Rhodococcus sp. Z13]
MTTRAPAPPRWATFVPIVLTGAAILAQITYPLTSGGTRDAVTVAVVTFLTAACLTHAAVHRGPGFTLVLFAVSAGGGYLSEVVGTTTGFPYGCYVYATDRLGPSVLDVPLVVPLAWTAGLYPVWCVASRLFRNGPARIAAVTVGMLGWDLYLDPQMVADGQWTWCNAGGLPGIEHIPLTNYAGWLLVAALMGTVLVLVDARSGHERPVRDAVPVALFLWTWLGSALAHSVFLDAPELRYSAVYGFVVMGVLGVPLLVSLARSWRRSGPRLAAPGTVDRRP